MQVEQQKPNACAKVMQIGPDQSDQHQLRDRVRERARKAIVGGRRVETRLQRVECDRDSDQEQRGAAYPVQNGDDARKRQSDLHQIKVDRARLAHELHSLTTTVSVEPPKGGQPDRSSRGRGMLQDNVNYTAIRLGASRNAVAFASLQSSAYGSLQPSSLE